MTSPGTDTPRGRRGSERVKAGIVLVLTLVVGMVVGIALDRTVIRRGPENGRPRKPDPLWILRENRPDWQRGRDRMVRDLALDATQAAKLDTIMAHRSVALRALRRETEGRVKAMLDTTRAMTDSILTPVQRAKLHEIRARRMHDGPAGAAAPHGSPADTPAEAPPPPGGPHP